MHAISMAAISCVYFANAYSALAPAQEALGKEVGKIKILQFNVLYENEELSKAIPWIIAQGADVVVLQEVNNARALELGELKKHYAWSQIKTNESRDAFGMAIFSNKPVTKFDYIDIGDGWNHYTMTELLVAEQKIHLYELHTPPPVYPYFSQQRDKSLELMADILAKDQTPYRLLVGDLNCTIYSPYLQDILKEADMHHAQQGYNVEGTWPDFVPSFLRIGIDQLLASKQVKIEKRTVAGYHGSDHMPVITTLEFFKEI